MTDAVIRLTHVSKSFSRGRSIAPWQQWWTARQNPAPANQGLLRNVIDDVSLTVVAGERIALIGNNGAGKSTLLKLISRILVPDSGEINVRGRISSLLELGIGFHPEMTGSENIYFYGSLMGMPRSEVAHLFTEIEGFADIGAYINQPVKVYSSGMYQRLAFASAFAMRPDVLIADEGLSVGDATFQQKCLNRIEELGKQGTTILIVAHNAAAMLRIATRGIWLDNGGIRQDGPIAQVSEAYAEYMTLDAFKRATELPVGTIQRITNPYVLISESVRVQGLMVSGTVEPEWDVQNPLKICADIVITAPNYRGRVRVRLIGAADNIPLLENDYLQGAARVFSHGTHTIMATIPPLGVKPGLYRVGVAVFDADGYDREAGNSSLFVRVHNNMVARDASLLTESTIIVE
jgi:ABC-type polysaccharide/polyol phosphate transport system ATPase subunit